MANSDIASPPKGRVLTSPLLIALATFALLAWAVTLGPQWLRVIPEWLTFPVAQVVGDAINWIARDAKIGGVAVQEMTRVLASFFDLIIDSTVVVLSKGLFTGRGLMVTQSVPPLSWLAIGGALVIMGYRFGGRRLAAICGVSIGFLVFFGLWENAMVTLASVLVSVICAMLLGLALGIWSYRSARVENISRGLMNVMQTVPIFSYLVPTLLLFGYGPSAALVATVIYALPPMVHNTVLALKSVPTEITECGRMIGCKPRQLLWQVQLPAALGKLAVGMNQAIMMTLNMVIIASMIGAGGLGYDVLRALRKLDIGGGLEAGMGIVALAIILDRVSQAAAHRAAHGKHRAPGQRPLWQLLLGWLILSTGAALLFAPLQVWPDAWEISTAEFWNAGVTWINKNLFHILEGIRNFALLQVMRPFNAFLQATPWTLIIGAVATGAWLLGGVRLALYTTALAMFIVLTGYWGPAMSSVYLITLSVLIALIIGYPIGFWLSSRPRAQGTANFVLDTMQTLPTLVYLLPAVMLFRIGDVSAVIAVILYAIAPAVRYAMVGMAQVPHARLEAAQIAGCTRWQTLKWVRLPAALPTLLIGVNQTIMMAFSMLIIAALVGTKDLGQEVLIALNRSLVGEGIVAGLCVACLALIADGLLKAGAARAGTHAKRRTN
ncbi:ABC transporter permease subunit [Rhodobacteraceae bacterium KMM 6894]|nr:ABC transporter permease subunit [Rhodobacteraceae bacterium KMM 6894]